MFDWVLKTSLKAPIKVSVSSTFLALAIIWLNTFFFLLCKFLFLPIFKKELQVLLYKTYFYSNEYLRKKNTQVCKFLVVDKTKQNNGA